MLPEKMRAKVESPREHQTTVYLELDYRELQDCMVAAMREAMNQERKRRERAALFYGIVMLIIAFVGVLTWNPFHTSVPALAAALGATHVVALLWIVTRWL